MRSVYGPVDSWRLGRSLGVDILCTEKRYCSFDCVYCQLQPKGEMTSERRKFVDISDVREELEAALEKVGDHTDYITLSGTGEPTLAKNLSEGVDMINDVSEKPTAILTNGSLFDRLEVREPLLKIDYVIAELDSSDVEKYEKVNRPAPIIDFWSVIDGYKEFISRYDGKFSLEVMFVEENRDEAEEIAEIAREIGPDEVQINTPLRRSPVEPLSKDELKDIENHFEGLDTINVYEAERKKSKSLDDKELIKRGRSVK